MLQWLVKCTRLFNNTLQRTLLGGIWEVHKAVIRRALIAQATNLKKQLNSDITFLLSQISDLSYRHKMRGNPQVGAQLGDLQTWLKHLLDTHTQCKFRYLAHKWYYQGNRCGRKLMRALKRKAAHTYTCIPTCVSHPKLLFKIIISLFITSKC